MTALTLPISSLKSYLNKALIFVNQAKLGLNPLFSCILFKEDKGYVYNGETGAIINFPLTVPEPTLLFPFDLAQVVNSAKDSSSVTIEFDYKEMFCRVKTENIKIKIKLIDPNSFREPEAANDIELFEIEGFYDKIRRASFCRSIDASLPLLQGIRIDKENIFSMDQRAVWREQSISSQEFTLPQLLSKHIERLGLEPTGLGITNNQIFVFYPDMTMFGSRLAVDNYPNITAVFENVIHPLEDFAVVKYDRESFTQKLETLLALPRGDDAIKVRCSQGTLSAQNSITDTAETEGVIDLAVSCDTDFDNVIVQGELFKNGVERFSQFSVKADQKRLLFWNTDQEYCLSRRKVG